MARKKKVLKTDNTIVCAICGGRHIETKVWINPNTKKFIGSLEPEEEEDTWCHTCEAYTPQTTYTQFINTSNA